MRSRTKTFTDVFTPTATSDGTRVVKYHKTVLAHLSKVIAHADFRVRPIVDGKTEMA
ncbi:MAG: hypothetical protein WB643_12410 [Candidatus Bathyarchaeia archaeon]